MMDTVEKVAEAMWQAEWARAGNGGKRRVPWSEIAQLDQERYRFVARAAIEAMRIGEAEILAHGWGDRDTPVGEIFNSVIDAALVPSPPLREE